MFGLVAKPRAANSVLNCRVAKSGDDFADARRDASAAKWALAANASSLSAYLSDSPGYKSGPGARGQADCQARLFSHSWSDT